jgi:hypothetical protein
MASSPVQVTTTIVSGRARSVRYRLDGTPLAAAARGSHDLTLTPERLGTLGRHVLTTTVRGRHGAKRTIRIALTTAPCSTLFTAQRWRTTAGFGLRLRLGGRPTPVRYELAVPRRGAPAVLLGGRGRPSVRLTRTGLAVAGLPAGTAVAEVTLYRVTRLDGASTRRALPVRAGVHAQTFASTPRAPR